MSWVLRSGATKFIVKKIKQTKSYMSHEFIDDAVPLPSLGVPRTVLPVRDELQSVREAYLPRHRLEQVHAKTVKPGVPRIVFLVMHHHVGSLLQVVPSTRIPSPRTTRVPIVTRVSFVVRSLIFGGKEVDASCKIKVNRNAIRIRAQNF